MRSWLGLGCSILMACGGSDDTGEMQRTDAATSSTSSRKQDQTRDSARDGGTRTGAAKDDELDDDAGADAKRVASKRTRSETRADAGTASTDTMPSSKGDKPHTPPMDGGVVADAPRDQGGAAPGDTGLDAGPGPMGTDMDMNMDMNMDVPDEPGANTGSCCIASPAPGCSNPELQACVCERQPSCCEQAWDETCTFIVMQKYCQPGVRECVCGSEEGQWQQASCCEQSWGSSCDSVAVNKCGATPGCF